MVSAPRSPLLMLGIVLGFAGLAALALAAPEPLPDRTREPFVWQRVETLIGWPLPEERRPLPPPRPSRTTDRHDLVQTPALQRKTEELHEWFPSPSRTGGEDQVTDPQTYAVGDLRITLGSAQQTMTEGETHPALAGAIIMVEAPGMTPWRLQFADTRAKVEFGVGRIDPARPGPQILIGVDSGGRRCCIRYVLLTPRNGQWRETLIDDLEGGDEGLFDGWPVDHDGDGAPELRFQHSWHGYAVDLWPAPIYRQVRNGKISDVTDRPSLRPQLRARMAEAEADCRRHDNAGCATLVMMAGKLGGEDRAWRVMLSNYDRGGERGQDLPYYLQRYRSGGQEAWR